MHKPQLHRPPAHRSKAALHPRNRHQGSYDLPALAAAEPALAPHLRRNPYGNLSIDFANAAAVKALNRALLRLHYGIRDWDIPTGYLCPPIPGRADYLHYAADLLAADSNGAIPSGRHVRVLDIGTGANLVYPLLGQHDYGWQFVGADIDSQALANAARIVAANPALAGAITLRQQTNPQQIFTGVIAPGERFALTVCNPPFHASLDDAATDTARKWRGLKQSAARKGHQPQSPAATALNFGGQHNELACAGGETGFLLRMVADSQAVASQVAWFTSLVSRSEHLPTIYRALTAAQVRAQQTVAMRQGQKQSRFVAWSFLSVGERRKLLGDGASQKR
jgi:23S rRNA (adenine1618-N6)-methyltransferase